ncbi:unnamed protein product [Darwinula stevensoni]|uniref:Peroxinectin n=1 Tax=Darwinula stevensoni TaxID=69355 RepID=A0A7R9A0F0_9CRUS|nr:unnamed protein product [Darwinula stevensoni]CAG0884485.1 unnamed protein product [Darwinula stevensoni]
MRVTLTLPITLTLVVIYTKLGGSQRSRQRHFPDDFFRFPSTASRFSFDSESDSFTSVSPKGNYKLWTTFGKPHRAGAGNFPKIPQVHQSLDFPLRDVLDDEDDDERDDDRFLPFPSRVPDPDFLEPSYPNQGYHHGGGHCKSPRGEPGECLPMVRCVNDYESIEEIARATCHLPNGSPGLCCLDKFRSRGDTLEPIPEPTSISARYTPSVKFPELSLKDLNDACTEGLESIDKRLRMERDLFRRGMVEGRGSAAGYHQQHLGANTDAISLGFNANRNVETCRAIVRRWRLSADQAIYGLPYFNVTNTLISNTCPQAPRCKKTIYRSLDGSCNNLRNPAWGRAQTPFQRILPPAYEDGFDAPRVSVSGAPLPSVRLVSITVSPDVDRPHPNISLLLMQFGQFVDHDITFTPVERMMNGTGIMCCQNGTFLPRSLTHPACYPIAIPPKDPFFSRFGQTCMPFVRSLPAPRSGCNFGIRNQMNGVTGWIDLSTVYGSGDDVARTLRAFRDGRLMSTNVNNQAMLPLDTEIMRMCSDGRQDILCFRSGDTRVNENIELTSLHIVWHREHNRLAEALQQLNPHWDDETLYHQARRINIAALQHMTYNEFLPIVFGTEFSAKYNLIPQRHGYTKQYNESINPTVTNVFSTAAYRFGHTLVQGWMQLHSPHGDVFRELEFSRNQNNPSELYRPESFDGLLRGMVSQPSQEFDTHFTNQLSNLLFRGNRSFGLDLVALNTQRGRDHGLPGYNFFRELCGLPRVHDFHGLLDLIDPPLIEKFRHLYTDVDDIDLYIGGLAERPLGHALVGPTFACLVGDQFARFKRADRFWYEEGGTSHSFTEGTHECLVTAEPSPVQAWNHGEKHIEGVDSSKSDTSLFRYAEDDADNFPIVWTRSDRIAQWFEG